MAPNAMSSTVVARPSFASSRPRHVRISPAERRGDRRTPGSPTKTSAASDATGASCTTIERELTHDLVLELADVTLATREGVVVIRRAVAEGAEPASRPQ